MKENTGWRSGETTTAHPSIGRASRQRPISLVVPGSRVHRLLLSLGPVGSILFTSTFLLDGAFLPGYNWLSQPMSALSLGQGGWVQVANFIVFGALTCCSAAGWRATLAPGGGSAVYPVLKVIAGAMLIIAGVFDQDPAGGFPPRVSVPAEASVHGQVHTFAAVLSLLATIVGLLILSYRLHHEPGWRYWGLFALLTAMAMAGLLAAFGSPIDHGAFAGMFEKLASIAALIFNVFLIYRLLLHHGRLTPTTAHAQAQEPRS